MTHDEDARRKRAALLRQQIAALKSTTKGERRPADAVEGAKKPASPESPRDFIHRRMREIDQEPKK